jgi:hypothetical protein
MQGVTETQILDALHHLSVTFARALRHQAEHRCSQADDLR